MANPYDIKADWGLATYDVRNLATISAVYELPIGKGKQFVNQWNGFAGGLVSGWSVNSIVLLQGGFPFTPQLSYNPSNNGDTRNPVRPFVNPDFTGSIITGNANQWFNPAAFLAPPANSGFYGNLGRNTLIGPGLATWDFSAVKDTRIHERTDTTVPRGDLQPAQSREFQYPELNRLYADRSFGHGRRHHQHLDDSPASAVRTEAAVVMCRGTSHQQRLSSRLKTSFHSGGQRKPASGRDDNPEKLTGNYGLLSPPRWQPSPKLLFRLLGGSRYVLVRDYPVAVLLLQHSGPAQRQLLGFTLRRRSRHVERSRNPGVRTRGMNLHIVTQRVGYLRHVFE